MIEVKTKHKLEKLRLHCNLCPGDICTLTAAVKCLHTRFPNRYLTDVVTPCNELFENNPYITPLTEGRKINCHYPLVNQSTSTLYPFLEGYTRHLGQMLKVDLRLNTTKPDLYLTAEEGCTRYLSDLVPFDGRPVGIVNAGVKKDITTKAWPHYQELIYLLPEVQWVQIGTKKDLHDPLDGAINLIGQTNIRQLMSLVYHCNVAVGPVTFLQHLAAAFDKPYVCLLGGREPANWVQYPMQHTLHTIGLLSCCAKRACWRSRVVPLGDKSNKDERLCEKPVFGLGERPVAQCMAKISACDVAAVVERILDCSQ